METASRDSRPGEELDKFKRRLIRAVARLLLQEKKPEDEIWTELKKETGCDCQLLWVRMRALTMKKLDRLLLANDRMDAVPKAARMSLTDWLLFDLVLVHQKIDLIGQNNAKDKEDCQALVDLFELVKMFKIEYMRGEKLAEAWSMATLYYNNKGHHCSPMLLQRRWYQLKQITRFKFYDFWYAYRGNQTRVDYAQPYKPSPLQTEIAKTYKLLILQPFPEWEYLIKQRLVTMPDEFDRKMKEKVALRTPVRKPSSDGPDLVMIEPSFDTIDLRLEQDDDVAERNTEEEPLPPIVRIKEEPLDDMYETHKQPPKKSLYEVVLETTDLENEELDSMDAEVIDFDKDIEETEVAVRHAEESMLPQISSVFGNVSDTSLLANIDENRVYGNAENTDKDNETGVVNLADTNDRNDESTGEDRETIVLDDVEDNVRDKEKEKDVCEDIDEDTQDNVEVFEDSANDKDNVDDTSPDGGDNISVPGDINEISDDDDVHVNTNVTSNADETSVIDSHADATNVTKNVDAISIIDDAVEASDTGNSEVIDNVNSTVENTSELVAIANEPNTDGLDAEIPNSTATKKAEGNEDVEIIETVSPPVVIADSDDDDGDIVDDLIITNKSVPKSTEGDVTMLKSTVEPIDVDATPEVTVPEPSKIGEHRAEDNDEKEVKTDTKSGLECFMFGELPNDISFADEGIVYVDEDHNETKKYIEEVEDEGTLKIDEKLLMCPVVYTTRLDDMSLPLTHPLDHINDKNVLDVITKKSKPIIKVEKVDEGTTVNDCKVKIEDIQNVDIEPNEDIPKYVVKPIMDFPKDDIKPIIHVPKEDIKPIIDIPNNDEPIEDVFSDNDYESDANVIDESQKVKPTSILLQKPRSRQYNPIQVCKNPDFNTRLKRLSVGFFTYPRNRVLIKSCKPLTIDLSKTFESKLISGTLYLKPPDHNVVTEVKEDTESRNVSVLPSALPAQSLIDNSKAADILPMLRQCLESSKQPVVDAPTTERNKVINLPDITEIRRINQRLLTAEITPIQMQNNQPQVPVTLVTHLNTPNTHPVQSNMTNAEIDKNFRADATDARGPPKLLEITDDSPAKPSSSDPYASSGRITLTFDNYGPQLVGSIIGRPPRMLQGKRLFPTKPVVWKPRQFRPEIPWLSRNSDASMNSKKLDDTLLTLDALNKMLYLLTDTQEPENLKKKSKMFRKNCANQTKKRGRQKGSLNKNSSFMRIPSKTDEPSEENPKCQKPKININYGTNCPRDRERAVDAPASTMLSLSGQTEHNAGSEQTKNNTNTEQTKRNAISERSEDIVGSENTKDSKKTKNNAGSEQTKGKVQYCCWARQRMLQMLFCRKSIPSHDCPKLCMCCCRSLLKDYFLHDQKIKLAEMNAVKKTTKYSVTDEETAVSKRAVSPITVSDRVNNASQTIDTSIQVPDVLTFQAPATKVDATSITSNTNTTTENEPIDSDAMDIDSEVPVLGGEVSVITTEKAALAEQELETPLKRSLVTTPLLLNHNFKSGASLEKRISSDNKSGGIIFNAIKTRNTKSSQTMTSNLMKILEVKKSKAPVTVKTNTLLPPIVNKPSGSMKCIKEKVLFLNSKHISEKPTTSPVFLGKNKILLTTVKFPPNLKLFHEAKHALRSSLKLPQGVHIVLLPSGLITYKIDPNVEVTATDMGEMPAIIAAIQAKMDLDAALNETLNVQIVPPSPSITESEVVDLVDDDDEPAPNVNENNISPLATEVQTTNETVTKSSDHGVVSHNSQIDTSNENRNDSNNTNSIVTDMDRNQNENAEQNTVTDIEEDVQKSRQNEILLTSTEQVQSQPDLSNQEVRPEIDDLPKPSTQTESTDVHKVSIEMTDKSKLSGQIETTDIHEISTAQVQGLFDPSSQNVSTEINDQPVHGVSAHQTQGQNISSEVQDHPLTTKENVSPEVPQPSTSEPYTPKTKNILSDLMEMSGIFDEDLTPDIEETHDSSVIALPAPAVDEPAQNVIKPSAHDFVKPPAMPSIGTPVIHIPAAINKVNPVPPKLRSPLGELTPITSLYELKYACANKGVFYKLDFESGFLVPINVCMKTPVQKPVQTSATKPLAPKSVIDLTEDDDKAEDKNTEPDISPTKRSLLLVNNFQTSGFTGPVKPVKLFKALKPSILKRLDQNKIKLISKNKNPSFQGSTLDHKMKRKQFLRTINLNAGTNTDHQGYIKYDISVPAKEYVNKTIIKRDSTFTITDKADEPTPTTSCTEPNETSSTTILSDDDSSDDEPLAKKAKRKHENASKSVIEHIEIELPAAVVLPEAPDENENNFESPTVDNENVTSDDGNYLMEHEAGIENQGESETESELAAISRTIYMSDDDDELMEPEEQFGIDLNDSNDEDEGCILGV